MDTRQRATVHAALGDTNRLKLVDALGVADLTVRELGTEVGLPGNLLAHHLKVLEQAGLIERHRSEGDARRRYVSLRGQVLSHLIPPVFGAEGSILFVCTHNSARSQYAAARWREATGRSSDSAGSEPATRVHPLAIKAAADAGIDLSDAVPRPYGSIGHIPDLLVSVCDRVREGDLPAAARRIHWSIPDPVATGRLADFRSAFAEIDRRIERLAGTE
jgi:protein-tyrosine-phosphatase